MKCTISGKQLVTQDYHSFEHNFVKIPLENKQIMIMITVYRLRFVPVGEFIEEFEELLEKYTVLYDDFVIVGDVNIHMETEESSAKKFKELLDLFDLEQHVMESTHIKGHIIDAVITPNKNSYIMNMTIRVITLSESSHFDRV